MGLKQKPPQPVWAILAVKKSQTETALPWVRQKARQNQKLKKTGFTMNQAPQNLASERPKLDIVRVLKLKDQKTGQTDAHVDQYPQVQESLPEPGLR